jgi:hypothetical protein
MEKIPRDEMEIVEIRKRLTDQDRVMKEQSDALKEIMYLLKGSVNLNMEGLVPMINKIETSIHQMISDIEHLKRWKKMQQENRGKFTISFSVLLTRVLAIIGGFGTVIAIALGIKQLLEWLHQIER